MSVIEVKNNCLFFEKEPIMFNIVYLMDDLQISINNKTVYWADIMPDFIKEEVNKELKLLQDIYDKTLFLHSSLNFSLSQFKQFLEKINHELSHISFVSIENLYYDSEYDYLYFNIPVQMKVLTSLFVNDFVKNYKKNKFLDCFAYIDKYNKSLENKRKELIDCNDQSFVDKKLSPILKKIEKMEKKQILQNQEKEALENEVNDFINKYELTDIYNWINGNVDYIVS